MNRIIISDPHGCIKTLLALIEKLPKDVPITFAGDLVDRGPNSKAVVEFVKNGGYDCVVGNHEVMLLDELTFFTTEKGLQPKVVSYMDGIWLMNGGDKCLDSYLLPDGQYDIAALKSHKEWLATLPYYKEYPELKDAKGNYLLVSHTTADRAWTLDKNSDEFKTYITWDRDNMPARIDGIYNVYGHTPQKHKATIRNHFSCIDGGVYLKPGGPYGRLSALSWPDLTIYEQDNIDID